MTARTLRWTVSISAYVCLIAIAGIQSAQAQVKDFNVPAQSATTGIPEFARQAGIQILVSETLVRGKRTTAVIGALPIDKALVILLEGTGLSATSKDGATFTLSVASIRTTTRDLSGGPSGDPAALEYQSLPEEKAALSEIVVTGTHIRGVPSSSPLMAIDRSDIERSGYTEVSDLIRALPQNFSGGNNPQLAVGNAPTSGNTNYGGSSPNLRGLGPESTLTLVNGHRLAQDGQSGAVDISLIPLEAIERIEVLTDSSSAAYGSDAVAGVVNIILRKDFDGAETNASLGRATQGGAFDRKVSQMLGTDWQTGGALLVFQHDRQDQVDASQRSFTATAPDPLSLLPASSNNSGYLSLHQVIAGQVTAFLDGFVATRTSDTDFAYPPAFGIPTQITVDPEHQYFANVGLDANLGGAWKGEIVGSIAEARNNLTFQNLVAGEGGMTYETDLLRARTRSVELDADGPLFHLATNSIRVAVGAGYRQEALDSIVAPSSSTPLRGTRDVAYGFAELNVPLQDVLEIIGSRRLEINASGRYDRYSDVGGKFVPKYGLLYEPIDGFKMRGSWSRSFRAPALYQLDSGYGAYVLNVPNPSVPLGNSNILYLNGANSDLRPETATSWTGGFEYTPQWKYPARFAFTYFDINYENRIYGFNNPGFSYTSSTYAPFLTPSPSTLLQQAAIVGATNGFFNYSGAPYDPATIAALVEGRPVNISSQHLSGVDLLADYKQGGGKGEIDVFANVSYLELRQQIAPESPDVELAGVAFNVPRWRARAGATWEYRPWSATAILNWLAPSVNSYVPGSPQVGAWTTVDLQLSYSPSLGGIFSGIKTSLSVQNLFDKDPPYLLVNGVVPGLNYDSSNASPLGRFITLRVSKAWGASNPSHR